MLLASTKLKTKINQTSGKEILEQIEHDRNIKTTYGHHGHMDAFFTNKCGLYWGGQNVSGTQDCIWYADTLLTRLFPDSINDCNIVISISICTNTVV